MNALATIHVGKKALGLDDDTYRLMLVRVTGKDSAKDMSETERLAVVREMRDRGFQPSSKSKAPGAANLTGKYGAIARALWLSGWNLGVFGDRTDEAILRFVKRQTKIEHLNWVRDPKQGSAIVDALKARITRSAGVVWPTETFARGERKTIARARKEAVHLAQHRILEERWNLIPADVTDEMLDKLIATMGVRVRAARKPRADG